MEQTLASSSSSPAIDRANIGKHWLLFLLRSIDGVNTGFFFSRDRSSKHRKTLASSSLAIDRAFQPTIPISISRVNQVDAARLDVEMSAMLKELLVKAFSLMKPGMLFQYEAELDAFLEFLIWRFSIWVDKPTPGIALMNLRYRDERAVESRDKVRTGLEGPGLTVAQKMWYCIATVGGQYIWASLQSFSAFRRWGDTEQRPLARGVVDLETKNRRNLWSCFIWKPVDISLHGKDHYFSYSRYSW